MRYLLVGLFLFTGTCLNAQPPSFKVDHIAIVVTDLERSATFYQEILGMKEIKNETGDPKIRWFAYSDARELHLLEGDLSDVALNKSIHLALRTDDLQGYIDYLKQKAYPFENWYGEKSITNDRPDGIKQIYLQDPDGYWIEVNDDWEK